MIDGRLAERAEALRSAGSPFVVATVVRAQHPASVRPGDAAIVRDDGSIEGFVGGVCAESSVRLQALRALETGEAILLRILPPEGGLVEPGTSEEGAVTVQNPCLSGGALEIFLEPRQPPPRLVVFGETPIARAVAELGDRVGFEAVRPAAPGWEPGAGDAAVVVASHGRDEEGPLAGALREGVPYVALVASPARGEAVRAALEVPAALRAQLHTPAGLEIGARTAAEIALAILAELVATRAEGAAAGRPGRAAATAPQVAVDPVCGMEVAVGDASVHLDRGGRRFYFCGEGCRGAFAAEAASHADTA
ncbi:MAG: XdhC family protein [Solirubrobacterales bacterium]